VCSSDLLCSVFDAHSLLVVERNVHWRNVNEMDSDTRPLLCALRVATRADLGIHGPITDGIAFWPWLHAAGAQNPHPPSRALGRRPRDGILAFRSEHAAFLGEVTPMLVDDALGRAARRFERAACRDDRVDELVDLVVSLEGLLTSASEREGEITYRLRMRLARLLGRADERKQLKKQMTNAYSARSKLVHGASDSAAPTQAMELRNLTRRALAAVALLRRRGRSDVSEILEHAMLGDPEASSLVDEVQGHPVVRVS
jgi:ElaB/YqjD/DUF883 family membrane-anchored ribosome-binding protein